MKNKTIRIALTKGRLENKTVDLLDKIGYDVTELREKGRRLILSMHGGKFFEISDLGFGRCKFALAGKKGSNFYEGYGVKTVATKYPEVTRGFFENKGMDVDIVKIEGSVELAPLVGLADGIVDIVETGTTLKENGLEVWEDVAPISARLIVNTVSMKLKQQRIAEIVKQIEENL